MKYKHIQLNDGTYAVSAGRGKYFTNTVTPIWYEAKRAAYQMSAQWYYAQAEKMFDEAQKDGVLTEYDDNLGDWLC